MTVRLALAMLLVGCGAASVMDAVPVPVDAGAAMDFSGPSNAGERGGLGAVSQPASRVCNWDACGGPLPDRAPIDSEDR